MSDFEKVVADFLDAINDHRQAHIEAMQSDDKQTNQRYAAACKRVQEAEARWSAAWRKDREV
jgi:hypothetical protein